jgi:hypothetical protein
MLHIWDSGVVFLLRERRPRGKTQPLDHPRRLFSTIFCIYRDFLLYISPAFTLFLTNRIRYTLDNNNVSNKQSNTNMNNKSVTIAPYYT